jgi:malate dehydrogenase (oxaloacetate-decarboxylating)(NADP+)
MSDTEKKTFTDEEALNFHRYPTPGQDRRRRHQADGHPARPVLAYSPGVAVPVHAIAANPDMAYEYTSKGNLVAVISNGTAILGLGDLGALASSR